jgi:hypothetical protein
LDNFAARYCFDILIHKISSVIELYLFTASIGLPQYSTFGKTNIPSKYVEEAEEEEHQVAYEESHRHVVVAESQGTCVVVTIKYDGILETAQVRVGLCAFSGYPLRYDNEG